MNKQKAKQILEKLRLRTESRGATPAEAETAARTAERIAKRYGLDIDPIDSEEFHELQTRRFQSWASNLGHCMGKRFGITGFSETVKGRPARIYFRGPEHLVSVAIWLFKAIESDLNKRSYVAARSQGYRGSGLTSFRNSFRESAVMKICERLFPEEIAKARIEQQQTPSDGGEGESFEKWKARMKKLKPNQLKKVAERDLRAMKARKFGAECGAEIELGTNAVGDRQGATAAIEH